MKKIIRFLLFILVISLSILTYSRFVAPYHLETREYKIVTDNIPDSFSGLKIVHFSDLHYLRLMNAKQLDKIINEINLLNPDITVFTGDLIDPDTNPKEEDIKTLTEKLSTITSKYGKYAVIGNHDYNSFLETTRSILKNSNFQVLENTSDVIYNEQNDKILIGGIANVTHDEPDIEKTITSNTIDEITYKIILVHEPDYIDEIIDNYEDINLVLAGHSHNGQVRLPFIGALFTPEYGEKYPDSYYHIKNTDLYVSGGLGLSTANFRLFNSPSLNLYRINKK